MNPINDDPLLAIKELAVKDPATLFTVQTSTSVDVVNLNLYTLLSNHMFASPRESRIMGFVLAVLPVESVYVAKGVVVPATYEYNLPPTKGAPFAAKNCCLGVGVKIAIVSILPNRSP
jgi:hypothetical protein